MVLRQCLANDDVPILGHILRLENIGEQGDGMAFRTVMGPFNQAEPVFFGPARSMVFDFGGDVDIGATLTGNGGEIRAAATAEGDGGYGFRQSTDDEQRRQLESLAEPAEEVFGGDGHWEAADSSQALMQVIGGRSGNERVHCIQADDPGQRVADAVGGTVEVGVAGDDADAVGKGQLDESACRLGGIGSRQGV